MKYTITSHWTDETMHEVEAETLRLAVERLVRDGANLAGANLAGANLAGANLYDADLADANLRGANLRGANLYGANLRGAYLYGANLRGANLRGANLRGANLYGANLYGAYLAGANLYGANLYGANLRGAYLRGAYLAGANLGDPNWTLIGERPYFSVGPVGSRADTCSLWLTSRGAYVQAGCFFDTLEAFLDRVEEVHGANLYGVEYRALALFFAEHARLWTPKEAA